MKKNTYVFLIMLLLATLIMGANLMADAATSSLPIFSANTTAATSRDVVVTITYPSAAVQRQYRVGNLNYRSYDGPVIMASNGKIYARWINAAGNISAETSYTVTNIDKTAPKGKLTINNGDSVVYSQNVTLNITADNAAQMLIWNENDQYSQSWRPYSTIVYWSLSSGDGSKTVHVKFKDALGNESGTHSDSVKLAASSRPALPIFNLSSSTYYSAQTLSIYAPNGTAICYTLDGSEPGKKALWYTSPILISYSTTIKAKTYKDGLYSDTNTIVLTVYSNASATASSTYTPVPMPITVTLPQVNLVPGTPTMSPVQGSYTSPQWISISGEYGSIIRYTLDNSEPTESSPIYYLPMYIDKTTQIKAKVYKNGVASVTAVNLYIISAQSSTPSNTYTNGTSTDINSLYSKAMNAYNSGRYDDAIIQLNQILSLNSNNEDAVILLADCYIKKGDINTAKDKLKSFLGTSSSPKVANKFAEVCIAKGDYQEAKQKILDLLPNYQNVDYLYTTLASLYDKLSIRGTKVFVYGNEVDFSKYNNVYPMNIGGRTLVPVKALCDALGAPVSWDSVSEKAAITLDGKRVVITNGSIFAQVNGLNRKLEIPARMVGGRLMVPIKFVGEHLEKKVNTYTSGNAAIIAVTK